MEKNIAIHRCRLERARDQLVALAQEAGVELRQTYARLAGWRCSGATPMPSNSRMRKALKKLKGYTGRVMRDLRRQLMISPPVPCATG